MCNRHAIRANLNKASKQAKRDECLPREGLVQGKRHVVKKALRKHTALYRTFTISKVNLNLQYFCLMEIWKSEVQGWNLSEIFGILTSVYHKQRTLKHRNSENGSKSTNHKSQTMTFWTRWCKLSFPKKSTKMIGVWHFFDERIEMHQS